MRKIVVSFLIVLVVSLSSIVSAEDNRDQDNRQEQNRQQGTRQEQQRPEQQRQEPQRQGQQRHDWSHPAYQDSNWHKTNFPSDEPSPFRWHDSGNSMRERFTSSEYRMDPINDQQWNGRFPGLHSYRWHDGDSYARGFWYQGERINDAVLFFDNSDELVSVGFMFNGTFIFIRDDQEAYDHHESSLLSIVVNIFRR